MAIPPIEHDALRPFTAPVLLETTTQLRDEALLFQAVQEISAQIRISGANKRRRILRTTEAETDDGLTVQAIVYRESAPPAWIHLVPLNDENHHLVVIAARGSHLAICASDGAMRDRIVKTLACARRMPRDAIAAFVGSEATAIWLNGTHTPTSAKADTKAMTGPALEYSLDPIGDQTYYYSAVRSVPEVPGLQSPGARPVKVGAAPASGRIWLNRASSWNQFKQLMRVIIDHAVHGERPADPFSTLAQPVDAADGIHGAYGLAVVPSELLSEDEISAGDHERARRWAFDARYEVAPGDGLSLEVSPSIDGQSLGRIALLVQMSDGLVNISADWIDRAEGLAELENECMSFVSDPDSVKIYYESGHTVAQGRCYAGGFQDHPFPWSFLSFQNYAIDREKPVVPKGSTLAAEIAANGDTSLFAYCVEKLFVDEQGKPRGWLASDDGSMELADFIHIDPDARVLTLVHVKASGKVDADRLAAPSEYEIVVSQAVKNLRHLDRRNLIEELERGKARKIGAAVWHDGVKQPNRQGFLAAAAKLPASTRKVLMVLQPRVTQAEVERCLADGAAPNDAMRIKQIDTLMLGARASALSCGATFEGIGDRGQH